jgi:stage V sporulation protein B
MIARGAIMTVISQVVFLISGLTMNMALARLLGPEDYGTFGLVISILIIVEIFVNTGIPEAVKKFGGEKPELMGAIVRKTLPWQLIYGLGMFVILIVFAPQIGKILQDDKLTQLLRIASANIIFYGLHKYFTGVQSGLHNFLKFSLLNIVYSLSKLVAIVGIVLAGFSVIGALVGNVVASTIGLIVGISFAKFKIKGVSTHNVETKKYMNFVVPNLLYFVGLNLFFSIDLWFVKYHLSDLQVGYYVSAATLSKMPYFLSIGLTAVLLPSLSHTIAAMEKERTREIMADSLRYVLIFLVLMAVACFFNGREIITFLMGKKFIEAGPVLGILISGLSLTTTMLVIHTFLMAKNLMKLCFYQILLLLILDVILNAFLVPRYQLFGAAFATFTIGLVGTIVSISYIFKDIKDSILPFAGKLIVSIVFLCMISVLLNYSTFHIIFKLILLSLVYFTTLILLKIISTVDIERFKAAIKI